MQKATDLGDSDPSNFQWACVSVFTPSFTLITSTGETMQMPVTLGAPFLRAFYTVYRRDGPGQGSIGIAPRA
jgi:hypothetical protein